ncbi:MAG: nuclear transport factor 2 family protein [Phototrophicaceae bacterium]|jgi:ketosteroid isomerase-like protein
MYYWILRQQLKTTFAGLNNHVVAAVTGGAAPDIEHVCFGDHSLGGTRYTVAGMGAWYERLFTIFPNSSFVVTNIITGDFPQNTHVGIEFVASLAAPDGKIHQVNVSEFITIKWAKVTKIVRYEDTQKIAQLLSLWSAAGVAAAAAKPIGD